MLRATQLHFPNGFSERGDDPQIVMAPWPVLLAKQVHSATVVVAGDWAHDPPKADAIVTDRSDCVIGIVTADCAPVLCGDANAGVIGAAHAGWRGAVGGVLENTIVAMEKLGARRENIVAVIGPTIAQKSYEVDEAVRRHFDEKAHRFFKTGAPGRWQFDLPGYVADRLRTAEVGAVHDLAEDTYSQPERFYSYRRATHRGEPTGGRQISSIFLA